MTNPSTRSGGRRRRSAKVSEVDDTSIRNKHSTEGYACSLSWLPRSQKGFPPRRPIVAAIWCYWGEAKSIGGPIANQTRRHPRCLRRPAFGLSAEIIWGTYEIVRHTLRVRSDGMGNMTVKVLIFDIGGTVFDWNTAVVETLDRVVPQQSIPQSDRQAFALACRALFMDLNGAIMRGEKPWLTADQILATVMDELWARTGLQELAPEARRDLAHSWRRMPAWPGAREAIASLREKYMVVPLTILSWPMAVGSSRKNGINWDSILSCDILGIYKPDPRCYARAAEIVDCAPGDIMMVASHPSDLRAGMAAGYRSAYVLPRLEDPGDDYTDTGFAKEFEVMAQDFADLVRQLL